MDDLENRVQQFITLSLPGQPMSMHMGTSRLVNDLWREVQRLRALEARPTMPAPDAVDSAASTSIVHASAESTSESES